MGTRVHDAALHREQNLTRRSAGQADLWTLAYF